MYRGIAGYERTLSVYHRKSTRPKEFGVQIVQPIYKEKLIRHIDFGTTRLALENI